MRESFQAFELSYWIGHVVAWVSLIFSLGVFARLRPWRSRRTAVRVVARIILSVWAITALATALEGMFALLYDASDSYGLLNTSRLWFKRHVHTNNLGYRDVKDFSLRIPPGKKRIVLMGDSFAFGGGITRCEQRFGDLIEARLEQVYPGEFQFYNTAWSGADTVHELAFLDQWRRAGFEMNAVLLVYVLNDIQDLVPENERVADAVDSIQPSFWLWQKTYLFNFLYYRAQQFWHPELSNYFAWLKDAYRGETWEAQRLQLDILRSRCQERGIKLCVAVFPFLHNLGADYPFREAHQALDEYWSEHGVPAVDLLTVMEAHASEGLVVSRFDAHPNVRGHALAAEAIWDGVVRTLVDELRSPRVSQVSDGKVKE